MYCIPSNNGILTENHETPFFWVNLKKNLIGDEKDKDIYL